MVMPVIEELVNRGRITSSTREKYKHDYISSIEWFISRCESFKKQQQSFNTVLRAGKLEDQRIFHCLAPVFCK